MPLPDCGWGGAKGDAMEDWEEGWKVVQAYRGRYFSFNPVAEDAKMLAETGRSHRDDLLEYWIDQETRPAEEMPPLCLFSGRQEAAAFLGKFSWLWQPYGEEDGDDGVSLVVLPCRYLPAGEETTQRFPAMVRTVLFQFPATVFAEAIAPTGEAIPASTFWKENYVHAPARDIL